LARSQTLPEFLQYAISPAYGTNFLGIHLAPTYKKTFGRLEEELGREQELTTAIITGTVVCVVRS